MRRPATTIAIVAASDAANGRRRVGRPLLPVIAGVLLLAVAACDGGGGSGTYRKSGADAAQGDRELADCRARVDAYLSKDRNIDEDRRGTYAMMSGRPGASSVRERTDANSDKRRSEGLVANCMQAKGYSSVERPPVAPR